MLNLSVNNPGYNQKLNYIWIINSNKELFLCSSRYLCWNSERIRTDELDQLHSNEKRFESYCMTPNVLVWIKYIQVQLLVIRLVFRFIAHQWRLCEACRCLAVPHSYYTNTRPLPDLYYHRFTHYTHQFGVSVVHFPMVFKNCLPVCIYVRVFGSVNLKSFRDKSYKCGYTWIYMNMLVSLFQKWPKSFSNRSKSFGSNSKETSFGFSIFN